MKDLTERPFSALSFTLPSLRKAYQDGAQPKQILVEFLARLADVDDPGIFIHLPDHGTLLAAAEALGAYDADRPLWGMPFAVKDNIDVAGMPTTAACPAYEYQPANDAFVVAKLRAAGAIPVGKTNLDQFATGLVGIRSPYAPPRNALDPEIVPGGSSSGSAVSIGHGLLPFSLGTDTAGSGRVPAALNGIVGLKPTLGALSRNGVVPACRTLDTISIFATNVDDAAAVYEVAAGYDRDDPYSRDLPVAAQRDVARPLRVAVPDKDSLRFFGDTHQSASFAETCETLRKAGAKVVSIDFAPFYAVADLLYEGAWVAERYTVVADLLRNRPDSVHPVTRTVISKAETMSAADAFRCFYRLADLKRQCEPLIASCDMICVPTIPTFYSVDDLQRDPVAPNSKLGTYTNFVNLLDLCALAVPVKPRRDGRPGSVTLIGPAGSDSRLSAVAMGFLGQA